MRKIALMCLVLLVACGTAVAKEKPEVLSFTTGEEQDWKLGDSSQTNEYQILEFIREGDDINNWKELLTMQNFTRSRSMHSAEEMLNLLKEKREKVCPGATQWNVIDRQADSVLYEWHMQGCLGQPEQSEVAKIIFGKHNIFFLHYAAKVHELPPDMRDKWLKRFSAATIKSGH